MPQPGREMVFLEDLRLTLIGGSGPVDILKGVNLRLGKGETVSVAGPSGSGKTSMVMVIAGLERPTSGTVRVAGRDMAKMGEDQMARFRRGRISVVFQAFHLVPAMTALENVALPLELAGRPQARGKAADALGDVGLAGRMGHYPAQLSGGEQQRVALARAFVVGPRLLLADEPTGNLDRETGVKVMDMLFELRELHGSSLLLITHDPVLAGRCGRALTMNDGRLAQGGGQ